jgi:hypothetical protein
MVWEFLRQVIEIPARFDCLCSDCAGSGIPKTMNDGEAEIGNMNIIVTAMEMIKPYKSL